MTGRQHKGRLTQFRVGRPFSFVRAQRAVRPRMELQTPSSTPAPMSLAEHIALESPSAEAQAEHDSPAPVQEAAPVAEPETTVTPEQEADSVKPDADLSEAARTLRKNRASERKAKIQREIDEAVREREQTRAEIAQLRREREALQRGEQPQTRQAPQAGDPSDPEPQEKDFADYVQYVDARASWAARREFRAQQQMSRQRAERDTYERELSTKVQTAREKYADFDAVLEPVIAAVAGNPRDADISHFVAQSTHGEDVLYRLGKDPAARESVLKAPDRVALIRALAAIELDIAAPKSAPKPITAAPQPPSQTVGSRATAATVDTRKGVPLKDHIRIEEAEIAERRRQGLRN